MGTRQAALRLLDAVLRRGEMVEGALPSATKGLSAPDRALAHHIAASALRWLGALDTLIDGATRLRLADDAKARMVLRIALVQALVLATPAHAAIATALPLVQGGPRRLVHGVFSHIMRAVEAGELALPPTPPLPAATAERWAAQWGADMPALAAQSWAQRPPLDLSLRPGAALPDGASQLLPGHARLPGETRIAALPGFAEGQFWAQDLAASLPARLFGAGEGRAILDLCAAPGGKTMQLAAAGWRVTALDNSQRRMARLRDNLARTGLAAQAECICADAFDWQPTAPVDAILLDAPCSATGIFRRHGEVLHLIGERQIAERAELQARLLARAAGWLTPGGRLVYAVCSLERREGEEQLAAFLRTHPDFAVLPVDPALLPGGLAPQVDGTLRTLPGQLADTGGLDGFFIAMLTRQ